MNQYAPDVTILHIESHKLDHNGLKHKLGQVFLAHMFIAEIVSILSKEGLSICAGSPHLSKFNTVLAGGSQSPTSVCE